jgi:X-Pro dipeptidyl-peptidase
MVMLVAGAFAGCIGAGIDAPVETASALPGAAGVTSYLRNVSPPIEGLGVLTALVEHVPVAAADGILLDTWIVRPDVDEPVPLVLEVTPYYGGGAPVVRELGEHFLSAFAEPLVARGYAVGISSVRGTGNSEGCFTQGGPQEAKDSAAVIEALAAEPWSNGAVGLIGVSYPGTTPQDVWVEAPPALKTIVPISGISDLYKYNFVNGVPIDIQGFGFNTYYWAMVGLAPAGLSGGAQPLDPTGVPGAVVGEACTDQLDVQEGGVSSTLDGNKDSYWQARDFLAELQADPAKERASVFYIHGLQDWNVKPHMMEDWLDAVWDTGVPVKVWIGQWGHNWPDRADWFEEVMVAWFDQFLKGVDTGVLDAPAVQVQDDDMQWRHEARWPPQDVAWLELFPGADGTLGAAPGEGSVSYDDANGDAIAHLAGLPLSTTTLRGGGAEQVVFTSAPLEEDLHLAGMPLFEGDVTASGRRASLVLTLAEELEDGKLRPFNFAALSLNHAESLESGADDVSGKTQRISLRFFPQDDVLHKGSRLVLIASGNVVTGDQPGPSLLPVSDGSTITLDLAGARLVLPVDATLVYEDPQPEPRQ